MNLWGLRWRSRSKAGGVNEHLLWHNLLPALFRTRREARAFAEEKYGYIRKRPDLRAEPHGWRMPIPIKVAVIAACVERLPLGLLQPVADGDLGRAC